MFYICPCRNIYLDASIACKSMGPLKDQQAGEIGNSADLSPDGTRLITASGDGIARIVPISDKNANP